MTDNELMQVVQSTAFNVQNIGEQMGLVVREVKNIQKDIEDQKIINRKISDRMDKYEERVTVARDHADNIRRAIHKRSADVLGIEYDKNGNCLDECIQNDVRYRGKFISRIYSDARKNSQLGTPYYMTKEKDYEEVIEYIAGWYPYEGVDNLKMYFDKRRLEKLNRAAS